MKRIEATFDGKRVTLVRESDEHLTAEQKYTLFMTMTGCAAVLGFFFIMFVCAM